MRTLRTSPFKANRREDNPFAFGLRVKEVEECADALFNKQSVMLSGPRGIGKSSLGDQLQIILDGNNTLLKRCGISSKFPKTLCIYYACSPHITLSQLIIDILLEVEKECFSLDILEAAKIKPSIEINLGVVKAKIEGEASSKIKSPSTLASQFVSGLESIYKGINKIKFQGINIFLDELDQLPNEIEFGSFMKIVHETLDRKKLANITFIFVGQQGIYNRFRKEHPSFERIIRYVPLSILDSQASEHVIDFAAKQANPPIEIDIFAKNLLLGLASGYPDILHLIGNAAFLEMSNPKHMIQEDVLKGVESVLMKDRREKYLERLRELGEDEAIVLNTLSRYSSSTIPAQIPYHWINDKLNYKFTGNNLVTTLNLLVQKGYLVKNEQKGYFQYTEELFRIFINMLNMERLELQAISEKNNRDLHIMKRRDEELQTMIRQGDVGDIDDQKYLEQLDEDEERELLDLFVSDKKLGWQYSDGQSLEQLDPMVRKMILREVRNQLLTSTYLRDAEHDLEFSIYDMDEGDSDRIQRDLMDDGATVSLEDEMYDELDESDDEDDDYNEYDYDDDEDSNDE